MKILCAVFADNGILLEKVNGTHRLVVGDLSSDSPHQSAEDLMIGKSGYNVGLKNWSHVGQINCVDGAVILMEANAKWEYVNLGSSPVYAHGHLPEDVYSTHMWIALFMADPNMSTLILNSYSAAFRMEMITGESN